MVCVKCFLFDQPVLFHFSSTLFFYQNGTDRLKHLEEMIITLKLHKNPCLMLEIGKNYLKLKSVKRLG